MMRSLYAGVSGLQNHQYRTDVIGNNIANINTNGFKKNRVQFQDMLYQTLEGAARPSENKGGVNPKQVGLGSKIASVDTLMYQGSLQTTGKKTDLGIQGEGFFILKKGEEQFYTRAGNYMIDANRNLVNPSNGFKIQGWNAQKDDLGNSYINNSQSYEDIYIGVGEKDPAKKTTEIVYQCNLDARVDAVDNLNQISDLEKKKGQVHYSSIDIYDEQGNPHKLELKFTKASLNEWQVEVSLPDAIENSLEVDLGPLGNINANDPSKNKFFIRFNDQGAIESIAEYSENGDLLAEGELHFNVRFRIDNGSLLDDQAVGYEQNILVRLGDAQNFNGVTQLASETTTKAVKQDGYTLGYLNSFDINSDGILTGIYSNGQKKEIAQIALASFINPNGLEKVGESNYKITNNTGIPNVAAPNSPGKGLIVSGALEMSNVDLAEEFTNMIVAQRGFQANSKIITTSDQMLQELLTLKR